ncbi:MAG: L,L-diaminopimelate aminotransferase [Candidatus Ozemobacter sibiricus]|jgi:LL-diaminopimelate aminotransferase|uniref:LL-diaminopimelate aminotransferase n=1 Tax=Candidatus Ozemobacter sibiricus TaxID=2268124 RepID=A0A367ZNZ0_9BACT|nr:MAG: L,L-diaminopimelate aminotransferase [Candidatus Ozemobacter sibiricus]
MLPRNPHLARLKSRYLFAEIARRRREFAAAHPEVRVISLGIGDTTEPLVEPIVAAVRDRAIAMGTREGYTGYGDEQGMTALRQKIAEVIYGGAVTPDEVFVSDGCKCDIGRLQLMFGPGAHLAVQDPSYPAYVDSAVLTGMTGDLIESRGQFAGITYLPCHADNGFFPVLEAIPGRSVVYFCSPNNPTGAVATRDQLTQLVAAVRERRGVLVFDAAYSAFIHDDGLPRSIYEIPGAREVAIETGSFSKPAGFTGVRLGWTVVPRDLRYEDGTRLHDDFNRIVTTIFNGASVFAQAAGLAALSPEGLAATRRQIEYYMGNARLIRETLEQAGFRVFGGVNAPYLWARIPGKSSWEAFDELLHRAQVVATPGAGFGPAGEGYLRFSAFAHREDVEEAVGRLRRVYASSRS